MTKREIASLFLKLIGVYFLVSSISWFYIFFFSAMNIKSYDLTTLISPLFQIIVILAYWTVLAFLIAKSDIIAAKLVKQDKHFELSLLIDKDEIIVIAFCLLGLFLLIKVIPNILSVINESIFYVRNSNRFPNDIHVSYWSKIGVSRFISIIFNSAAGIYLFLYPKKVIMFWKKISKDGDIELYQLGEAKVVDDLSLEDMKEHPVWAMVVDKHGKSGSLIRPVINSKNVSENLIEPVISFHVEGSKLYGSADYDKENQKLVNLTLWIGGKWVLIQDTSDLVPPLTLIAIPRINGRSNVKFIYENFDHSEAFIDLPDSGHH